jgi:hypothetical protein
MVASWPHFWQDAVTVVTPSALMSAIVAGAISLPSLS